MFIEIETTDSEKMLLNILEISEIGENLHNAVIEMHNGTLIYPKMSYEILKGKLQQSVEII